MQNSPWSYVARFAASEGYIYLKQTPPALALEAKIIHFLREQFHAPVAEVIASHDTLHCFLMHDGGPSLRSLLKKSFDEALLQRAFDQFIVLQIRVANHIDSFTQMSVPDWRMEAFPALYQELLSHQPFLIADGVSKEDLKTLERLHPRVADLSQQLADYAIPSTLVQPDFNDNNTLVNENTQAITIIDLGEIAIAHPFFSLLNGLHQIKKHHAPAEDVYYRIQERCLNHFLIFESKENVLKAFNLACQLFPIYGAIAGYRLKIACDPSKFIGPFSNQGKPGLELKEWIKLSRAN